MSGLTKNLKNWLDRKGKSTSSSSSTEAAGANSDTKTISDDPIISDPPEFFTDYPPTSNHESTTTTAERRRAERLRETADAARDRIKLTAEAADRYARIAFKNLRWTVLEALMSDSAKGGGQGLPSRVVRKVRRKAIAAVIGEDEWAKVELQYELDGGAWEDPEAVARAMGALELADAAGGAGGATEGGLFAAWQQMTPLGAHLQNSALRLDWLEKQGYITDRANYNVFASEADMWAWYFMYAYLVVLALFVIWLLVKLLQWGRWAWNRMLHGPGYVQQRKASSPRKIKVKNPVQFRDSPGFTSESESEMSYIRRASRGLLPFSRSKYPPPPGDMYIYI